MTSVKSTIKIDEDFTFNVFEERDDKTNIKTETPKKPKSTTNTRKKKWLKCPICDFRTKKQDLLSEHRLYHQNPSKCGLCSYESHSDYDMVAHFKIHRGILTCPRCEFVSSNEEEMIGHRAIHLPLPVNNKVTSPGSKSKKVEEIYKCDDCNYLTHNSSLLKQHRTRKHQVKCQQCGAKFMRKEELERHTDLHKDTNPEMENMVQGLVHSELKKIFSNVPAKSERKKRKRIDEESEDISKTRQKKKPCENVEVVEESGDKLPGEVKRKKKKKKNRVESGVVEEVGTTSEPVVEKGKNRCPHCDFQTRSAKKLSKHLDKKHASESEITDLVDLTVDEPTNIKVENDDNSTASIIIESSDDENNIKKPDAILDRHKKQFYTDLYKSGGHLPPPTIPVYSTKTKEFKYVQLDFKSLRRLRPPDQSPDEAAIVRIQTPEGRKEVVIPPDPVGYTEENRQGPSSCSSVTVDDEDEDQSRIIRTSNVPNVGVFTQVPVAPSYQNSVLQNVVVLLEMAKWLTVNPGGALQPSRSNDSAEPRPRNDRYHHRRSDSYRGHRQSYDYNSNRRNKFVRTRRVSYVDTFEH